MVLEEFALPPTVIQSIICRPLIQANNFELKAMTLQLLQGIQFHGLPSENPNTHMTSFLEICDNVKYNGGTRGGHTSQIISAIFDRQSQVVANFLTIRL